MKIIFSVAALTVGIALCQGKVTKKVAEMQKMKNAAVRMLRRTTGVDVTKLKVVRRSGQNLQATTNGWAYFNLYAFDDCSAPQGFTTVGIATDVCLMSEPQFNVSARSYYYTCNDGKNSYINSYLFFSWINGCESHFFRRLDDAGVQQH